MAFSPRDWREILVDKVSYITANTPLSSVYPGSVLNTLLEATSLEDAEQYFQMLEIIRNYYLDTTSGSDLDKRAQEYGLTRTDAKKATSRVTLGDSAFTKVSTGIYAGFAGPKSGDNFLYADSSVGFFASGAIIIGRNTNNVETVTYSSILVYPNYVKFNLSNPLTNDHGTDEKVVLSQGGNRIIPAGTGVYVPENDISGQVTFTTDNDATLLDGEDTLENVSITATTAGAMSNVPAGLIVGFTTMPYSSATVLNPERITNGKDIESDEELRDRIKLSIQGLSKGVKAAILGAITGLEDADTNKRVVSANVVESNVITNPSVCYIDDGTGFEPNYSGAGYEIIIPQATGGERILQLDNYPIMKGFSVTKNSETFNMAGTLDLQVRVGKEAETITFQSSDFDNFAQASAEEIAKLINLSSSLIEARTTANGTKIIIMGKALTNEELIVEGGTANAILAFETVEKPTLYLYKNYRTLLSKDGATASMESGNAESYSFSTGDNFLIKIDGKEGYQTIKFDALDITAELAVERINLQLQGATASVTSNGSKVSIFSNTLNSTNSMIKIGRDSVVTSTISNMVFRDSSLALDFPYVDQIKDLRVVVTSGAYVDNAQKISGYNPVTGQITLYSSIGGTLGLGDTFVIDGIANGNIGNPANTIDKLNFSLLEVSGLNKDYTLNRFQGQLELQNILAGEDIVTAGTPYTRAEVTTTNSATYNVLVLSNLLISVDGGVTQTLNIPADAYSAGSLSDLINAQLVGGRAEISKSDVNKVTLRTNTWDSSTGSIQVLGGSANSIFVFPTVKDINLVPHAAYLTCANSYVLGGETEYSFADNSNLIIVVDGLSTSPYNITLSYASEVTTGDASAPYTTFIDSNLTSLFQTTDFFKDFYIKFKSGANLNEMRKVVSYNAISGLVTVDSSFTNAISATDTYCFIPRTSRNISKFLNSTIITGLSNRAYIEEADSGLKVSISSQTLGSAGSINVTGGTANSLAIGFSADGTASGTFEVSNTNGIMIGQKVTISDDDTAAIDGYIVDIAGTSPYIITIHNARSGGAALDLSLFTVAGNAIIKPKLLPEFSTTITYGVDAYSYYTGLLQKVQWTIDGKEDDESTYPGVKAAGTQIEVKPPAINRIVIIADVTTVEGVSLISIQDEIKAEISNYINGLGVSKDVIISEIVNRVKQITGVYDVKIVEPAANISIGDEELCRVSETDITIG